MDKFNVICGVCSIAGLAVSLFTASKVVKISQTINCGNNSKKSTSKTAIHKSEVHGDVAGGEKMSKKITIKVDGLQTESSVVGNKKNEGCTRKGIVFRDILPIISLVISVLSLLISYRTIHLKEVEYQPHFICTTKNNEEYKEPENHFFKIHTIKNIGEPISNVEFDIQEVLCFQRTLTGESMDVLIWEKTGILNEDKDIKYDLDKQEIVIEGTRLEYIEYMLNSYFNSDSNIFFYEPYCIKVYDVTCKRILDIQYTDREGANCRECYEIKENHIALLDKIVKREDYKEIVDFLHGSKYELGEVYQDDMEQARDMITNMLGINIEEEKEELAKQYNKKD